MARGIARFFTQSITVETWLGTNSLGQEVFAAAQVIQGYAENKQQLVLNADGEQVVSSTTVYTFASNQPLFTPRTRVTVSGVAARAMTVNANGGVPGVNLPDHVAVSLV